MRLSAPRELLSWFLFDRQKPWHPIPPRPPPNPYITIKQGHGTGRSHYSYLSVSYCNIFYSARVTLSTPINWTYNILSISAFPLNHNSLCGHVSTHTHAHTHKIISCTPHLSPQLSRSQNSQTVCCMAEMTKPSLNIPHLFTIQLHFLHAEWLGTNHVGF